MTFDQWWASTQEKAPFQNLHREAAREIWEAALAESAPSKRGTEPSRAIEIANDIKAAIVELAAGRNFPDLLEAVDSLAAIAESAPSEKPVGWLYDWTHSSALGKPDEHFTGFTEDEAYARKGDNVRAVYLHAETVPHVPAGQGEQS